ncbi:helix-turn-helix domain-containing protein, partial [Klebsiella pneumoniae]
QIAERYKVSRTTIYKVAPRSPAFAADTQADGSGAEPHRRDAS